MKTRLLNCYFYFNFSSSDTYLLKLYSRYCVTKYLLLGSEQVHFLICTAQSLLERVYNTKVSYEDYRNLTKALQLILCQQYLVIKKEIKGKNVTSHIMSNFDPQQG